jgi:hypothetical protein
VPRAIWRTVEKTAHPKQALRGLHTNSDLVSGDDWAGQKVSSDAVFACERLSTANAGKVAK